MKQVYKSFIFSLILTILIFYVEMTSMGSCIETIKFCPSGQSSAYFFPLMPYNGCPECVPNRLAFLLEFPIPYIIIFGFLFFITWFIDYLIKKKFNKPEVSV